MGTHGKTITEAPDILLAAIERTNDAIVVLDSDLRVRHFNAAAERIWKLDRAEVLGGHVSCLGVKELEVQELGVREPGLNELGLKELGIAQPVSELPRHGERIEGGSLPIRIQRRDGSRIHASISVWRVDGGGQSRTIALIRDVSADVELRERLALVSLIADGTNRSVIVTDQRLRIVYTNGAFSDMFGYSLEEAKGQHAYRLLVGRHTDRRALVRLRFLIDEKRGGEEEILSYDKNGDEIWISANVRAFRNERGQLKYMCALLTDITETRQLRSLQQLIMAGLADELPITELGDRLCRRVEQLAPDVVCSLLHIDANGVIHPLGAPSLPEDLSAGLDGLAIGPDVGNCGSAAYYGRPMLTMDIDTDPRWQPHKSRVLELGLRACWSTPIKAKDGRVIGTFAFYFRERRAPSSWHQCIVDACVHLGALAIERQEARAEIARLAYYDVLTGLPNRSHLRNLISEAIRNCPKGKQVALAFIDVDNFKDVNDTLGHSAGDELLVQLAKRLREQIQPGDMLGRLGGDEFVVILPNRDATEAALVASKITDAMVMPLQIGSRHVPMSASMGLSIYPDNATDIDALIQQADAAMYQAKRAGRSTYRFFTSDMKGLAEQRLVLSAALRGAIASDGLQLHYQPQIRTNDGTIHGVEALARWHDPVLGDISPARFIPLAEESGLIEQIGMWSIREACRQMAAWRASGLDIPCMSVNLSPINF